MTTQAERDHAAERERLKDSQDGIDQRVAADPFNTQFRERAQ